MKNFNLSSRGRLVGLVLGVVLVIVAIYWVVTNHGSGPSTGDKSDLSTSALTGNKGGPGGSSTPEDQKLIDQGNLQTCKKNADGTCLISGPTHSGNVDTEPNVRSNVESCSVGSLNHQRKMGLTVSQINCGGHKCSCKSFRAASFPLAEFKGVFSPLELKKCDFTIQDFIKAGMQDDLLKAGFSVAELAKAGLTAAQLRAMGFTAEQLAKSGVFTPEELRQAGFTAAELAAVLSPEQLAKAGFTPAELAAAGLSQDYLKKLKAAMSPDEAAALTLALKARTEAENGAMCTPARIKSMRGAGDSLKVIRAKGCSLKELVAAGVNAADLEKAFGLSPAQLKALGYQAKDLVNADGSPLFTAKELRDAGYSAKDLMGMKDAEGNPLYSPADLREAGYSAGDLRNAGIKAMDLKDAQGGLMYPVSTLRNAGYKAGDVADAGVGTDKLLHNGYTEGDLRQQGLSSQGGDLAASCDPQALKRAFEKNVPVTHFSNCSIAALRDAGFTAKQLRDAGIGTAAQLAAAGYSLKDIKAANYPGADSLNQPSKPGAGVLNVLNPQPVGPSGSTTTGGNNQGAGGPSSQTAVERAKEDLEKSMLAQQRKAMMQQKQGQMTAVAENYISRWEQVPSQAVVNAPEVKPQSLAGGAASAQAAANAGGPILKAGTMMYAILNSSIDSDDNLTKAYATIVSGPLKGAKLIGTFKLAGMYSTKLMLTFDTLDLPSLPRTIPLQAVAVDPDTSHVALSGSVNNHFWQRYGVMFLGSFVQGVSEGLMAATSNTTVVTTAGGTVTPWYKKIDAAQLGITGLGQVGSAVSKSLQKYTNRLPTVDVPGGTGIGILIYKDLELPPGSLATNSLNG